MDGFYPPRAYTDLVLLALTRPIEVLLNLPHPLELIWLVWLILLPWQVRVLTKKGKDAHKIPSSGELMSFREIAAVSCVGGFILLSFIFAFCTYLTLKMAKII